MRRRTRFAGGMFALAAVLVGAISLSAGPSSAAPVIWKPLKVAVLNLESLNRDKRGPAGQSRRFFADLLAQGLKADPGFQVAHVDLFDREDLVDAAVRRYDLALGGDYIELLNGAYRINLRLYDVPTRIAVAAWSEEAPSWRGAFFEGREQADGPNLEAPALKRMVQEVREALHQVQVWRTLRDLRAADGPLKAQVKSDKPSYQVFETLSLTVKPVEDAYVTVLSLSSTGGARILFPRPKEEPVLARKNEILQVPGPGWVLRVADQVGAGEDCFKVILTREPLRLEADLLEPKDAVGATRLLESIATRLASLAPGAWGEATCLVKVSGKQK